MTTPSSLYQLAVAGVQKLVSYVPGKPIEELQRELGLERVIKLASNENPLGPSSKALAAMQKVLPDLALYPDGSGYNLKKALSRKFKVDPSQITLGNGSNELLELVARAFLTPGLNAVFSQHAFAVNPANNHLYLAWVRRMNAWGVGGAESTTIEFVRSGDGGNTFSPPVAVSTFVPSTGTNRAHGPQIASGSGSVVYVAWHTIENAMPGDATWQPPRIWIAESVDGGQTFGTNRLVATQQKGLPTRFISLGVDRTRGRIYIAYADRPNYPGDYDVYVASATGTAGSWSSTRINDNTVGWQFWPALSVAPASRSGRTLS